MWRILGLSDCRAQNGDSFELSPDLATTFARAGGIRCLPAELSSYALFLDEYEAGR
ncbi:hypothetical protein Athai_32210 [Actinocatenispora thailandica]|uniref:Uncharacterized protein n=1 Tax=Actinocatenispora thailandica TaxID=227318 RepID=A0A7R7HX99_9ACTN|nr:hypothetical protein Athai_32210 [Actinocatenispora thailandica]